MPGFVRVRLWVLVGLFASLLCAARAEAVLLTHTVGPGVSVLFPQVIESSVTDPLPLYDTPSVVGDTLLFDSMSFGAASTNGSPAIDLTDGQLNTEIKAKPGFFIGTVTVNEVGDYYLRNFLLGSSQVDASSPGLIVKVLAVNGVDLLAPSGPFIVPLTFSPSTTYSLTNTIGTIQGIWTSNASFDITTLSGLMNVTRISVVMDNQLDAFTTPGTLATISKKGVEVYVDTYIPEPSTIMLGAALAVGTMLRRRRAA